MKGTILSTGMVKGDDGKEYVPDMIFGDTVLLVCSSWARKPIKDVVGKRVNFVISKTGHSYNFGVLNKEETEIVKL